jgi:hypothetical protein
MSLQLSQTDFDQLVQILMSMSETRTATNREAFLTDVFAGSPRQNALLGMINFDGDARAFSVRLVQRLTQFGQDQPGRESLTLLLNKMKSYVGFGENADFLTQLQAKIAMVTAEIAAVEPTVENKFQAMDAVDLHRELRGILLDIDEYFYSDRDMRPLFRDPRLKPWVNRIPETNSITARVDAIIAYLSDRFNRSGQNALVLFLYVLIDRIDQDTGGEDLRLDTLVPLTKVLEMKSLN